MESKPSDNITEMSSGTYCNLRWLEWQQSAGAGAMEIKALCRGGGGVDVYGDAQ